MCNIREKIVITGVILIIGIGLIGCMKVTEKTDDAGGALVNAEDLPVEEGKEDGADTEPGKAENGERPEGESPEGQDAGDLDKSSNSGDTPSFHYIPDEDGDLYGDICEIGDMQFTVTKIDVFRETTDDGRESEIMVSNATGEEEESSKIKIVYDEDTTFEKQTIRDGGARHEEREGTAADLQKGFMVEVWGDYEGDVFHATAVKIVEVILD